MAGLKQGAPTPQSITVHGRSRVLEVGFSDGATFRIPFELMRIHSPSAEVQGHGPCQETLQTGMRHPEKLAGMLCLSGYLPLATSVAVERTEESLATPIFMAHRTHDNVVPFARARDSKDVLVSLGYQVEWHEYTMQHSLCLEEVQDISKWIRKVVG